MPAVHEKMHKRTSQKGQPKQSTEYMSLMLGEQQRSGDCRDDGKSHNDEGIARQAPACDLIVSIVWQGHRSILKTAPLPDCPVAQQDQNQFSQISHE
jgi:hypothetical protein